MASVPVCSLVIVVRSKIVDVPKEPAHARPSLVKSASAIKTAISVPLITAVDVTRQGEPAHARGRLEESASVTRAATALLSRY